MVKPISAEDSSSFRPSVLSARQGRDLANQIDFLGRHIDRRLNRLEDSQDRLEEGQKRLAERQDRLEEGQKHLAGRQDRLEEGQKRLEEGQKHLIERQDRLEEGQNRLDVSNHELRRDVKILMQNQLDTNRKLDLVLAKLLKD